MNIGEPLSLNTNNDSLDRFLIRLTLHRPVARPGAHRLAGRISALRAQYVSAGDGGRWMPERFNCSMDLQDGSGYKWGTNRPGVVALMSVGLDAFGSLDEALYLILGKAGFLDVAEQIHDLGLVMKVVDDFWVRGRGQAEQYVGISRQYFGQLLDYLWPWRTLLATFDAAQIGWGNAYLGRRLAQAEVLSNPKVAECFTKVFHSV